MGGEEEEKSLVRGSVVSASSTEGNIEEKCDCFRKNGKQLGWLPYGSKKGADRINAGRTKKGNCPETAHYG